MALVVSAQCSRFATKLEEDDVVIPRNQSLIIKTVMAYRSSIVEVAYISETDDPKVVENRRRLLQSTDVRFNGSELSFVDCY
jgi:hypothetical protein